MQNTHTETLDQAAHRLLQGINARNKNGGEKEQRLQPLPANVISFVEAAKLINARRNREENTARFDFDWDAFE